jgi:hypothetical protein
MMRIEHGFVGRLAYLAPLFLTAVTASGCGQAEASDSPQVAVVTQAETPVEKIAKACGLDINCEAGGLAEGNARISGVASVDSFFSSVLNFQTTALSVSGGIDADLAAIKADFGIAADADLEAQLKAQIKANVKGAFNIEAEPARCQADVKATLDASARCEAKVDPGTVMVACKGSCEVEASADVKCDAGADLKCTVTAPSVACEGECKGSCEAMLDVAASCSGTCNGSCDGTCSAYVDNGQGGANCAGKCDGMCQGSCEAKLAAGASCTGTCKGECTVTNPSGGCKGGIHASCQAKADAMVMCGGSCEGEIEPPKASAECEASVKAEAKINVQCTPPRLAINYELAVVASADLEAQARFVAAVGNLKVRLPSLLAKIKRASLVVEAGAGLSGSAKGAIQGAVDTAAGGSAVAIVGLKCALGQVGAVGTIVTGASSKLEASLKASAKLTAGLGV